MMDIKQQCPKFFFRVLAVSVILLSIALFLAPIETQARNIKVGIIDCYSGPPAVYGKDVEIGVSPFTMYAKELTITSTFVSPYSFPRSVNLLSKLELQPLITDIVPLNDIAKAFELHKGGKSIKILIKP